MGGRKQRIQTEGRSRMKEQNRKNTPTTKKVRAILSAGCAPVHRHFCRFGSTSFQ